MNERLLVEPVEDQAVKLLPPESVDPTDVGSALAADRHLPRRTGKPREGTLGRARVRATRCRGEAADAIREACGIDERVLVRARHLDAIRAFADAMLADRAAKCVVVGDARIP